MEYCTQTLYDRSWFGFLRTKETKEPVHCFVKETFPFNSFLRCFFILCLNILMVGKGAASLKFLGEGGRGWGVLVKGAGLGSCVFF